MAFLADCLQVTLKQRLRTLAPGLTLRAVLEKFSALQMVDVHLRTTDGRTLILSRHRGLTPRLTARCSADLLNPDLPLNSRSRVSDEVH